MVDHRCGYLNSEFRGVGNVPFDTGGRDCDADEPARIAPVDGLIGPLGPLGRSLFGVDGPSACSLYYAGASLAAAFLPFGAGKVRAAEGVAGGLRFTEDQSALIQLAKNAKRRGGLTEEEGKILKEWGDEYNVPVRGPESHPGGASDQTRTTTSDRSSTYRSDEHQHLQRRRR